jgi:hypothetical protein
MTIYENDEGNKKCSQTETRNEHQDEDTNGRGNLEQSNSAAKSGLVSMSRRNISARGEAKERMNRTLTAQLADLTT